MIHLQDPNFGWSLMRAFGAVGRLSRVPVDPVRKMVDDGRPPFAIRDKGISIVDEVASGPGAPGVIGRQCGSLIVHADPEIASERGYHSGTNAMRIDLPALVHITTHRDSQIAIARLGLQAEDPGATPLEVKKVPRNSPRPCGSDVKYKYCHGRAMPTLG